MNIFPYIYSSICPCTILFLCTHSHTSMFFCMHSPIHALSHTRTHSPFSHISILPYTYSPIHLFSIVSSFSPGLSVCNFSSSVTKSSLITLIFSSLSATFTLYSASAVLYCSILLIASLRRGANPLRAAWIFSFS